ncbi:hypothetical protein [Kitasatospora sp. NBC_01300]|uniref:hypothetical protein n=1 Tax=Kitasatospora sp. NBC_01300 TaxID=2903574 RepID=UPI00352EC901|nr:hypothetical protein OG556_05735 [Kitasatospora sp. NBC_01300]
MTTMHPAAIAFRDPEALRARCDIGNVRRVHGELDYENGAVVPAGDWSPLPEDHPERYAPGPFTKDSGLIEFFRLPGTVTDVHTVAALVDLLGDPLHVALEPAEDPPGELVTHRLPENGLCLGLHVDNHQNLLYPDRDTARRRLCVNLGPGSRYLLLADTDIKSICRTVHDRYETHCPHTDDLRMFVALRRPLKVLRVRIDPGEGWLAPTAVLPYDESTEGTEGAEGRARWSTTASWLGHWGRDLFDPLI